MPDPMTMTALAAAAAAASSLTDVTDRVGEVQKLLRATEGLMASGGNVAKTTRGWYNVCKPLFTAKSHYEEGLRRYASALKTIQPCIAEMDHEEAMVFIRQAREYGHLRSLSPRTAS